MSTKDKLKYLHEKANCLKDILYNTTSDQKYFTAKRALKFVEFQINQLQA